MNERGSLCSKDWRMEIREGGKKVGITEKEGRGKGEERREGSEENE